MVAGTIIPSPTVEALARGHDTMPLIPIKSQQEAESRMNRDEALAIVREFVQQ